LRLAAGPDTGVDFVPHGRLYEDIEWFVEAGLPTDDAVRIATLNGARAAGIEALPLVVVRGVVTTDVGAIEHVLLVVRAGRIVFDASNAWTPCTTPCYGTGREIARPRSHPASCACGRSMFPSTEHLGLKTRRHGACSIGETF
jgi:hypothetical protein